MLVALGELDSMTGKWVVVMRLAGVPVGTAVGNAVRFSSGVARYEGNV